MKWPFAWIGKPFRSLVEHKKAAWSGMPVRYKQTQPANKWVLRIAQQPKRMRCAS